MVCRVVSEISTQKLFKVPLVYSSSVSLSKKSLLTDSCPKDQLDSTLPSAIASSSRSTMLSA